MAKEQHESSELENRLRELNFSDETIRQFIQTEKELDEMGNRLDAELQQLDLSRYDVVLSDDYEISLYDTDLDFLLQ